MKRPAQKLQEELEQIIELTASASFFTLSQAETDSLREEGNRLLERLRAVQGGFLTVGLLGGTGVGKSTIMNGLAGLEIASTSHRRPHTDHVLVYRHAEVDILPELSLEDIPWREITHQVDGIRHILLCDLPDFDSLIGEHRQRVLQFLEHLDLLLWVVSPEKYADGRFYEFLNSAPKARENFTFVLNKVDLLFQGESPEAGFDQMSSVLKRFQELIKKNHIREPLVYAIAAQEVGYSDPLSPWNQFYGLKKHVFQWRDAKRIWAIKAANLDVEIHELASALRQEVTALMEFEEVLEESIADLETQPPLWIKTGEEIIQLWLGRRFVPGLLSWHDSVSPLVGPGYAVEHFLGIFQRRLGPEEGPDAVLSHLRPSEEIKKAFRRRLQWLEDRIRHRLLSRHLPTPFGERLHGILDVEKRFETLGERFLDAIAFQVADSSPPVVWGFKIVQWIAYVTLFGLLIFALCGEDAWRAALDAPGYGSVFRLLLSLIHALFSSKGLAALGSYTLVNLFLGVWFFRRYRRRLLRSAQKRMVSLRISLLEIWKESLTEIATDLKASAEEIRLRRSVISPLRGNDHGEP